MSDRKESDEDSSTKDLPTKSLKWPGLHGSKNYIRQNFQNSDRFDLLKRGRIASRETLRYLFGDAYGFTLFLASLAFFALYWRIGVAISDSYAVANGLVAVSDGQLHLERAVYGPSLKLSSIAEINGELYARNYGQIFLALPFLWLIQGVAMIADLRVALAGGWSLILLSLGMFVGRLLDREFGPWNSRTVGVYVGSVVALLTFVLVLRGATTIGTKWHHLIALQLQMMVAAGLLGVVIYRLLTRMYDRRIGLVAGGLVVFASPIAFWAPFLKRHVFVALAVFISIYCLYRSREARSDGSPGAYGNVRIGDRIFRMREVTAWRAAMYVPVGLIAWVNALEGFLLLVALLIVDVPTGGRGFRELAAAGFACLMSLVPFFITNVLISGNPLESPMTYRKYGSKGVGGQSSAGSGGGGGTSPSGGGTSEAVSSTTFDSFLGVISVASDFIEMGVSVVTADLELLSNVFLYSGYAMEYPDGGNVLRLSYLEAMPVAAVLVMIPIICLRGEVRGRFRDIIDSRQISPCATLDVFVVAYAILATLVYAPRLPLPSQITIRYLLVLFPLTAYGMMRVPGVRRVVRKQGVWFCSSYLVGVLIGGQLLFLYMYIQGVVIEEAFQIHSYVGLGLASMVAGWALGDAAGWRNDRLGAIIFGLGAAASTVFTLIVILWFWSSGDPIALPLL